MVCEVVSARQLDWKVRAPLSQNTCPHVTYLGLFEMVCGGAPGALASNTEHKGSGRWCGALPSLVERTALVAIVHRHS